ncbi:MAG: hypothetical protein Q8930_11145 [Bacillota bacterium]|nr:hypothetical protein [Bacillota bacterium]
MERDRRTFKQATANMNFIKKMGYIWYHYKMHIIAVAVLLTVGTYFAVQIITSKTTMLNVKFVANGMSNANIDKLKNNAESQLLKNRNKQDFSFGILPEQNADSPSITGSQELWVPMMAGDVDILVAPKGGLEPFATGGRLVDLSSIPGLTDDAASNGVKLVNYKVDGSNDAEKPYGIDMNSIGVTDKLGFSNGNMMIGIVNGGGNMDMAVNFLKWLMKQKTL